MITGSTTTAAGSSNTKPTTATTTSNHPPTKKRRPAPLTGTQQAPPQAYFYEASYPAYALWGNDELQILEFELKRGNASALNMHTDFLGVCLAVKASLPRKSLREIACKIVYFEQLGILREGISDVPFLAPYGLSPTSSSASLLANAGGNAFAMPTISSTNVVPSSLGLGASSSNPNTNVTTTNNNNSNNNNNNNSSHLLLSGTGTTPVRDLAYPPSVAFFNSNSPSSGLIARSLPPS